MNILFKDITIKASSPYFVVSLCSDVFKLQLGVNNKRYFVSADRTINCSCFMKPSTITELHKYPILQRIQAITHYLLQQSENWWNEVSHGRAQPRLQPATEARRHNQQYSWTIIMAGRWQDHIVHHTHNLKMTSTESISLEKTWWPQLLQTNCNSSWNEFRSNDPCSFALCITFQW